MNAKSIPNLELLRALAAALVFLSHFSQKLLQGQNSPSSGEMWRYLSLQGNVGVDLFFVLSGFVISMSIFGDRPKTAGAFLRGRIRRVVPLYWLLTLFSSAIILAATLTDVEFSIPRLEIFHLVSSLMFIAQPITTSLPVLAQGWTLEFEMAFYVLAGVSLYVFRLTRRRFAALAALVALLILMSVTVNGTYLEFLYGIIAFFAYSKLRKKQAPSVAADGRVKMLALVSALLGTMVMLYAPFSPEFRFLTSGLPALLIVFGLAASRDLAKGGIVQMAGRLSFSFYLLQWGTIPIVFRAMEFAPSVPDILVLIVCLTVRSSSHSP
jgi:peptidoglycan/LPS O-acetylase OafA/YrhL